MVYLGFVWWSAANEEAALGDCLLTMAARVRGHLWATGLAWRNTDRPESYPILKKPSNPYTHNTLVLGAERLFRYFKAAESYRIWILFSNRDSYLETRIADRTWNY